MDNETRSRVADDLTAALVRLYRTHKGMDDLEEFAPEHAEALLSDLTDATVLTLATEPVPLSLDRHVVNNFDLVDAGVGSVRLRFAMVAPEDTFHYGRPVVFEGQPFVVYHMEQRERLTVGLNPMCLWAIEARSES